MNIICLRLCSAWHGMRAVINACFSAVCTAWAIGLQSSGSILRAPPCIHVSAAHLLLHVVTKKLCQCYFLIASISIVFGNQHNEET